MSGNVTVLCGIIFGFLTVALLVSTILSGVYLLKPETDTLQSYQLDNCTITSIQVSNTYECCVGINCQCSPTCSSIPCGTINNSSSCCYNDDCCVLWVTVRFGKTWTTNCGEYGADACQNYCTKCYDYSVDYTGNVLGGIWNYTNSTTPTTNLPSPGAIFVCTAHNGGYTVGNGIPSDIIAPGIALVVVFSLLTIFAAIVVCVTQICRQ